MEPTYKYCGKIKLYYTTLFKIHYFLLIINNRRIKNYGNQRLQSEVQ